MVLPSDSFVFSRLVGLVLDVCVGAEPHRDVEVPHKPEVDVNHLQFCRV